MSDKLKPCPLCGFHAVYDDSETPLWGIRCQHCKCRSGCYPSYEEAAAAWNRRASDPLRAFVEAADELAEYRPYCCDDSTGYCAYCRVRMAYDEARKRVQP
jgi:hypothetical protein